MKVEMTEEEAKIFVNIQKWYTLLNLLEKHHIYGLCSSTLTLFFDGQGVISKVEKTEHLRP